jgi:hypothetical protein
MKSSRSMGTDRSRIGMFINIRPVAAHSADCLRNPSSRASSCVNIETTTSMPSRASALTSSHSQPPPRGQATIAMRLGRAAQMGYTADTLYTMRNVYPALTGHLTYYPRIERTWRVAHIRRMWGVNGSASGCPIQAFFWLGWGCCLCSCFCSCV